MSMNNMLYVYGTHDFKVDKNNEITVCRWKDSSVVNVRSNSAGIKPVSISTRYSAKEKKKNQI